MKLKTSLHQAIELATCCSELDIELNGVEGLSNVNPSLNHALKNKTLSSDNTFKNIFGPDVLFFYTVEQFKKDTVVQYERGIGYLFESNDKIFIRRHLTIAVGENATTSYYISGTPASFKCSLGQHLVVASSCPRSSLEYFIAPNSILTSIAPFRPHSFVVDNDCLVGRLDGEVGPLKINDKGFIETLIGAISKYTKQISLSVSKLQAARLSTALLQLIPTKDPIAKRGHLVYDEENNYLKYYNGTSWIVIK